MWRWESSVLPSRSCNWPGLRRSSAPPANRQWLDATVFLFHSRHQGRSQADGRSLLPGQALLDVPDQKRLVAARNFRRCLPIDRSALCLFRDVLLSYVYLLHLTCLDVCALLGSSLLPLKKVCRIAGFEQTIPGIKHARTMHLELF